MNTRALVEVIAVSAAVGVVIGYLEPPPRPALHLVPPYPGTVEGGPDAPPPF